MTILSRKKDEVKPGDLVKVKTLYTDKCHFYLVIDVEADEDPSLVTYNAFHDGKIVKMTKMSKKVSNDEGFIASKASCND